MVSLFPHRGEGIGQLGLKDDPNSDHRTMWLAIEKYISENLR